MALIENGLGCLVLGSGDTLLRVFVTYNANWQLWEREREEEEEKGEEEEEGVRGERGGREREDGE